MYFVRFEPQPHCCGDVGFSSFPPPSPSLKEEPHFHILQEGVVTGSLASTLFVPEPHIFGLRVGEELHFHSFHLVRPGTTHLWLGCWWGAALLSLARESRYRLASFHLVRPQSHIFLAMIPFVRLDLWPSRNDFVRFELRPCRHCPHGFVLLSPRHPSGEAALPSLARSGRYNLSVTTYKGRSI